MKRVLLLVVLVIAGAVAIDELSDLTQSRADPVNDAAVTELVVNVDEDRFGNGLDGAADALWAVCSAQTSSRIADGGELERVGEGRYRAVLEPAVGHHEEKKLVGCLEDLTVDRVQGDVELLRTVARGTG